jgi:ATPase subunit of ABC transporter with duplicated ATPase domains
MLTHYSGDYATYVNTVQEQKVAQMRLRVAYEKEKDKLREFISREGKKYDNPAHQAQVRHCVESKSAIDDFPKFLYSLRVVLTTTFLHV